MLRFGLKLLVILSLLGVLTLTVVSFIIIPTLPDIELLRDVQMQVPLRVYSANNSLIAEFGEKRRVPVSINETPQQMIDAFIAAEDGRFYEHPGVDWRGILRAVVNLVLTGEKSQGGSTITMQVARNFFLTREKTYLRKLNEIYLSLKIERELTKNEILELYLNVVFFGQRAHGVGAAAQVYYGTTVDKLTLPQIAMIAGLPQAPSTTNPVTNRNRATLRRNYVLSRMFEEGYITQEQYLESDSTPITASLHSPSVELEAPYVAEMVRREMQEKYGDDSTTMGYRVYTTIRNKNQVASNHALRSAVQEYDTRHGYRGAESHIELSEDSITEEQKKLLETFPVIANLYPALVTSVHDQSITVHLTGIGLIDIGWDGLNWARKHIDENFRGPEPTIANSFIQPGDIVRIIEDDQGQWRLSQLPSVEGAFISLNPRNGETLALTGGFDFYRSNFNRVIQAKRQPGSGFKPFIYSSALHNGYTAASIINDAPLVREYPGIEDTWRPENYSGRYYGPTRLREALINSRNIVSIRLLDAVGIDKTLKHISKFGFDIEALPHSLSLALGSGDLSPWEIASAYCVFANGGYLVEPYFIDRIEDNDGNIIYQAAPLVVCEECVQDKETDKLGNISGEIMEMISESGDQEIIDISHTDEAEKFEIVMLEIDTPDIDKNPADSTVHKRYAPRVIDEQNIWLMNSITRDVIRRGTGMRARVLNRNDLSGKTGTTNDQHDAWFFGYNPNIVGVAWVGFDDFRPMGRSEVGGRAALPMWIDYMRVVLKDIPEITLVQPPDLVTVRIDPDTGQLASADNPYAIFEVFRAENAPTSVAEESSEGPFESEPIETVPPLRLF
jgi:penicillin-binding protein 1A